MLLFQLLVVLASGLLCLSQKCQNEVYTNDLKYTSCKEILTKFPDTPSGYYALADYTEKVYCDMENKRCGSLGWTRVAYVNMSSETSSCPGDLKLNENPKRYCGGITNMCVKAKFSTHGITYSQVCGRMIGYQIGNPNGFGPYINDQRRLDHVLDGVLISHGDKREHIWAYVVGSLRVPTTAGGGYCPCASYQFDGVVPPFIGNDYYCDSGVDSKPTAGKFYPDPLWIGEGCTPPNFCCSLASMPWFCKTLANPTDDDIEIYNCNNESSEDIGLELIELYVH
ncbi:uncharacterized protein [Dysidea avara]|uniref:uncharacterized protein n=1 Tax=Dysidea avara TaxID=196820 RepID=UPI00332A3E4F